MNDAVISSSKFTGWAAIIGGILAFLNIGLVLSATGADFEILLHAPSALAMSSEARDLYRWGMVADVFGFYLPFIAIGVFLWRLFRDSAGAWGDMALLCIVVYVLVGCAGAMLQAAAFNPLAHLHAGGDDAVKAAAEAAWTAVAYGVQKGLWWIEGPTLLFWGLVVASRLKTAGAGRWLVLLLQATAWAYGLTSVTGLSDGLTDLNGLFVTIAVLLLPLWMIWFGAGVLRGKIIAAPTMPPRP